MRQNLSTFILAFVFTLCCNTLYAQKFIVYSVKGKVSVVNGNRQKDIRLRDVLRMNTTIIVSQNSIVELFDEKNRRKYIISSRGRNTIANMLKDKTNEIVKLSEKYFNYIANSIRNNNETVIKTCSDGANVTREELIIDSVTYASGKEE